jgi:hypothetical protein
LTVTLKVVPSLLREIVWDVSSVAFTTSSPGGPRAELLISVPVGSVAEAAAMTLASSLGLPAALPAASVEDGLLVVAAALESSVTCA